MHKTEYGDPMFSVRMPSWMITTLKMLARQQGTTVSYLLRDIVSDEFKRYGIKRPGEVPIEGQLRIEDL